MNLTPGHFLDRPILRDLFWFVVLPHRLRQHFAFLALLARIAATRHDGLWEN